MEQPFHRYRGPPPLTQGRLFTHTSVCHRRAWGVKTFPRGNDLLEICFSMQEPASILLTQNQASSTPAASFRQLFSIHQRSAFIIHYSFNFCPPHVHLHVASLREGGGFCVAKDGRSPRNVALHAYALDSFPLSRSPPPDSVGSPLPEGAFPPNIRLHVCLPCARVSKQKSPGVARGYSFFALAKSVRLLAPKNISRQS